MAGQQTRHDGRLAHQCVAQPQVAARMDGARVVGWEIVEELDLHQAGGDHGATTGWADERCSAMRGTCASSSVWIPPKCRQGRSHLSVLEKSGARGRN